MQRARLVPVLLALAVGAAGGPAGAVPTPVPGGANQINGVSGTMSQTLFNGMLRLRGMSLKDPVPADNMRPNAAGERAIVFHAIVSNGSHHENHGYFNATLADANGITVTGRPLDSGWSLQPGTAARAATGFSVPADFVPVRMVLIEAATPKAQAFRIAIRPTDLPPAGAAPAATP